MICENIILKGIGGFFYVQTSQGVVTAKPRGILRERQIKPLPGDIVTLTHEEDGHAFEYVIEDIAPRKNTLVRPAVCNVDNAFIIVSTTEPKPSPLIIDSMICACAFMGITTHIVITKHDLMDCERLQNTYKTSGYRLMFAGEQDEEILSLAQGSISVLCGNTGVGKSTLLNRLIGADRATSPISKKLGRGVHTTREAELLPLADGGYIADTPGFSQLSLSALCTVTPEQLAALYPEFVAHIPHCRFADCSHNVEDGCAVRAATEQGEINSTRYANYVKLHYQLRTNRSKNR